MSELEHCSECGELTGGAGREEDSIYVEYLDKEIGPLCTQCLEHHWVCGKCGGGVYFGKISNAGKHPDCGGKVLVGGEK